MDFFLKTLKESDENFDCIEGITILFDVISKFFLTLSIPKSHPFSNKFVKKIQSLLVYYNTKTYFSISKDLKSNCYEN